MRRLVTLTLIAAVSLGTIVANAAGIVAKIKVSWPVPDFEAVCENCVNGFVADLTKLKTGNGLRDEHMREYLPTTAELKGDVLYIGTKSHKVTVADRKFTIKLSDFGIGPISKLGAKVADEVEVDVTK